MLNVSQCKISLTKVNYFELLEKFFIGQIMKEKKMKIKDVYVLFQRRILNEISRSNLEKASLFLNCSTDI
jgi:hypothetical protein